MHTPVPYAGYVPDFNSWISQRGDALAAWVDLLVKASRDVIRELSAPKRLLPELARLADSAIEELSREQTDPDFRKFLLRVRQTDRDLVWDHCQAQFRWANQAET